MSLPAAGRKLLLAIHLTSSVGWIGAVCGYLVLAIAVLGTHDPSTVRAAWIGMELVGWYAIVPLAVASLVTGVLLALATQWCLFTHYWVLISLVATAVLTAVLVLHMPAVSHQASLARRATSEQLMGMGSDLPHAFIGVLLLIGILTLNVYKPRGLRYGWRRRHDEPTRAQAATPGDQLPRESS